MPSVPQEQPNNDNMAVPVEPQPEPVSAAHEDLVLNANDEELDQFVNPKEEPVGSVLEAPEDLDFEEEATADEFADDVGDIDEFDADLDDIDDLDEFDDLDE